MIRRRPERVRHRPEWSGSPFGDGALASPIEHVHPPHRLLRRVSTVASLAGALGFVVWVVLKAPAQGEVGIRRAARTQDVQVVEAVVPVPPPQERIEPEAIPPERAIPTTTPVVPQPPSVGLVDQGEAGGAGNGIPGLDLGLEGSGGDEMAVAAGGGGRGGGAGSGVGSGVGSQRFVYQLGQVDEDAQPEKIVDPPYPRRAKEDGVEAAVELRLLVDERGRVEKLEVLGAPPGYGFEAALKNSSQQWRFKPAHLGGVPVPQWVRMPYSFHLE